MTTTQKRSASPTRPRPAQDAWWRRFERNSSNKQIGWKRGRGEVGKARV